MINKTVVSGKRKMAVARAVVKEGNGKITINKMPYEHLEMLRRLMIEEPIRIANEKIGKINFDIEISVKGGGQASQTEACRLVVARALVESVKNADPKQAEILKREFLNYDRNLLVADTRRKEAYKPGDSKARAKRQKSYR